AFSMAGLGLLVVIAAAQNSNPAPAQAPRDAVVEAQTTKEVQAERPEQKKTEHDLSNIFAPSEAMPTTQALKDQTDQRQVLGFDLYKDAVGAMKPGITFAEIYKTLVAAKPNVMATQRKLLESRYNLTPNFDAQATMSRGKPLAVGPTARLPEGMDWDALAAL